MTDEKAREVAIALSQNLISFHKRRLALARTPMIHIRPDYLLKILNKPGLGGVNKHENVKQCLAAFIIPRYSF
jgi:hypothetical protein